MADGVGTLYLSEVLDTSHFRKGFFNIIEAPCGSGKTKAAIDKIAPLASSLDKAIYLIDTKLGKDRLAKDEKLTTPYYGYAEDVDYGHYFGLDSDGKLCVTTYAQFGFWCANHGIDFPSFYEYIICDEPQNLVNFSEIGCKSKADTNYHRIARTAIDRACWMGDAYVIGITATPKPLAKLSAIPMLIPVDRTNLRHYTETQTISYASFQSALESIKVGQRGGIYIKHIQPIIKAGDFLRARGFNPLMLWSTENKDHPLSKEQLDAREYLIEKEAIPEEYDVFLFNATAETSINIKPDNGPKWDFFIAHNTDETTITQSRGRYRGNLDTLYVYDRNGAIIVPIEFMNRNLNNNNMKELRDRLALKKDRKGHAPSIDAMVVLLNDNGYNCEVFWLDRKKTFRITKA